MPARRFFAIIPAAGRSQRMGSQKLLLKWKDRPILDHVLHAWQQSRVSHIVIIIRAEDTAIHSLCERRGVDIVCPEPAPVDMKESIQHGLDHLAVNYDPQDDDGWLVAPADLPKLNPDLIDSLIAAGARRNAVVAPRFGSRRGHPILFPWTFSPRVFQLKSDEGIDRIVADEVIFHVDLPASAIVEDVDTPYDYHRLRHDIPPHAPAAE